jgi:hypothetical protein
MGLESIFSGISLKSAIRDVTNLAGAFTGARPPQSGNGAPLRYEITPPEMIAPSERYDERENYFGEILPDIIRGIVDRPQPPGTVTIQTTLPKEQTESGSMENGPMVYQGAVGSLVTQGIQTLGRTFFGGGARSLVTGTVAGGLAQYGVGQMMAGDSCGCPGTKPFVRLDKCGRPIITRRMQAQAKEMVMCMGIDGAAQALGIDVNLLAQIAFKKFPPRTRGISGAQLKTAQRVNNKIMHMAKKLEDSCKRPVRRRIAR